MRHILRALLVVALLASAPAALASGPKLTLLFSANAEAEVRPCPS